MTIHASKGLQFPIVFLPELTNRYPLQKKSLKIYHFNGELCCNPDESIFTAQMQAGIEELQEIMRLVYVAITRACYYCRIVWTDLIRNRQLVSCTPLDWLFRMRHVDCSNLDDTLINFITQTQEELLPYQLPEPLCRHKPFGDAMPKVLPPADNLLNIHTPQTVAQVADSWRITSYSALPLGSQQPKPLWAENANEAADYDLADASSADTQQPNVPANGVWEITAGAAIGNAWHKILENMDFTSPVNTEYVAGVMRLFNFTDPAAHAASCDMFEKLLDHTLPCGMQLRTLTAERKITELEFLLDCRNGFDIDELCAAVKDHIAGEFGTAVSPSNYFSMRGGFFTGFIDMIFEYNGKFYIVDWKSNTLNKDPQEFYGERLKMNMAKKNYHIQYLCYCAALMKYLAWKLHRNIDNELYEQFFGGVYYIFLRGLTLPEPGGIFSARPPFAAIKSLTDVISPGKEADDE